MSRVAFLRVTTYGTHWYGVLNWSTCDEKGQRVTHRHELTYTITLDMAQQFMKYDGGRWSEVGSKSVRYWSRLDVVNAALDVWRKLAPNAVILFDGSTSVRSACQSVVACTNPRLGAKLTALVNEWRALDGYGKNAKNAARCREIDAEFNRRMARYW